MEGHGVKTDIKESSSKQISILCRQVKGFETDAYLGFHNRNRVLTEIIFHKGV